VTAASATAVDRTRPTIRALALSHRRFRAARRGSMLAAATGTSLFYRLSEPATVAVTAQRRRVDRRGRVTWRSLVPRGTLHGKVGANVATFTGRVAGHRLHAGRYRLRLQAVDGAGNRSLAKTVAFTIAR
jgi:hypothetical protein